MKKLRILLTPVRFYPHVGGVEKYALGLSVELVRLGDCVTVICANEPKSEIKNLNGIIIKRIPFLGKVANTNITPTLFFEIFKEKFDILNTYLPTPWSMDISVFVAKLKRKKVVVTYCNDVVGSTKPASLIAHIYNKTLLKLSLRLADQIIVIQPDYAQYSNHLHKYLKKILFIPPGLKTNNYRNTGVMRKENTIFFLSVLDKYHKYKGLDVLLEAVSIVKSQIPSIHLIVGGSGELVEHYREAALSLGIAENISFIGHVPDRELLDLYSSSSTFVLPSCGHEEGFGIVLLEAMACGTPVISTKIVGLARDIEQSESGIIVEPNNSHVLAESISHILLNKNIANSMGHNGRKLIEKKYSWDDVAKQVKSLYTKLYEK